ncbi:MAG: 16S rRNA (guanine(527)-N(7))-methyltransferase RsmG [Alphaproteobacteria bacterium]|nr:16S rRNA (guanine(527)-N(7))-methyltransferase RsmG [Alphaproteobacteria bacterium]
MKAYGPADFEHEFRVPRETMLRIEAFDRAFMRTAATMNLVARSTLDERWERHFRDSAQLANFAPVNARSLVDLGSGAGFPGLILAALLAPRGVTTTLVESTGKKAAFLKSAAEEMALSSVSIIAGRIESIVPAPADIITARALASLPTLLGYAAPFVTGKTVCIFPKGQDVEEELTEATKSWRMAVESRESLTRSGSQILIVRDLARKSG